MNYHPDDFLSLVSEVEEQGGTHTHEQCMPRGLRFDNQPPNITNFDDTDPRVTKIVGSAGCKRAAKFVVPLLPDEIVEVVLAETFDGGMTIADPTGVPDEFIHRQAEEEDFDFNDDDHPEALSLSGKPIPATVCAIDDAMGLWPRFEAAMHTGDSFI